MVEEVEGAVSGFGVPGFGVPGVVLPAVPLPGTLAQGDPLGVVPGVVALFGFMVDGWVLLPGVGVFVEFDPGTAPGVVGLVGGGVVAPVGGAVVVFVGGGALVGACAGCPPLPVAPAPLPEPLCADAHVAHPRIVQRRAIFLIVISKTPKN